MTADHGWYVSLSVPSLAASGRFVPRCECGWTGKPSGSEQEAAARALEHVRAARQVAT